MDDHEIRYEDVRANGLREIVEGKGYFFVLHTRSRLGPSSMAAPRDGNGPAPLRGAVARALVASIAGAVSAD